MTSSAHVPPTAPTPNPSLSRGFEIDLQRLDEGLQVIEQLRPQLSDATQTTGIDTLVLQGNASLRVLDVAALLGLGIFGHRTQIRVQSGAWTLVARADGPALPTIDSDGDVTSSDLTQPEIAAVDAAVQSSNAQEALRAASSLSCTVRIEIRNDPVIANCHWVAQIGDLEGALNSARWHAAASVLGSGPCTVVVTDLGAQTMTTGGLVIRGPQANSPAAGVPPGLDDTGYRSLQARDGRQLLPSPAVFAWHTNLGMPPAALAGLRAAFNGVARRLVWYWMAAETRTASDGAMTLTFTGARTVTFALVPQPAEAVEDDLSFYRWAAAGTDPARQEALQHAASLAINSASDLATGAAPALRTSRTLYELSRRTAISEALAASRSARDAALNAARQAADTARQTAGKAVERALLQLAAGVGVVLSNATDLLGRGAAVVLLVLVAALSVVSLLVTWNVELSSADTTLAAEVADLDQYRDVLASDDIEAIRQIRSIASAKADLRGARKACLLVYLSSAVAILLVGCVLVFSHSP